MEMMNPLNGKRRLMSVYRYAAPVVNKTSLVVAGGMRTGMRSTGTSWNGALNASLSSVGLSVSLPPLVRPPCHDTQPVGES